MNRPSGGNLSRIQNFFNFIKATCDDGSKPVLQCACIRLGCISTATGVYYTQAWITCVIDVSCVLPEEPGRRIKWGARCARDWVHTAPQASDEGIGLITGTCPTLLVRLSAAHSRFKGATVRYFFFFVAIGVSRETPDVYHVYGVLQSATGIYMCTDTWRNRQMAACLQKLFLSQSRPRHHYSPLLSSAAEPRYCCCWCEASPFGILR